LTESLLTLEDFVVRRPSWVCRVPRLEVTRGRAFALVGPSGCGKSSVLRAALGLPDGLESAGVLLWGAKHAAPDTAEHRAWLRRDVAVVLQDPVAALDPYVPVGTQIAAATAATPAEIGAAVAELGIEAARWARMRRRRPHEISGGEAQRCVLAVALLRQPSLVVADEPGASLDDANLQRLLAALRALRDRGAALLLATHDQRVVEGLGARPLTWDGDAFVGTGLWRESPWAEVRPRRTELGSELLRLEGVGVTLGGTPVLDGLDLALRRGEAVAIVGSSGAGKTTLGRVLAGHIAPRFGSVHRPERSTAVQMLFQDAAGSLTPGRSIQQLVDEVAVPGFDAVATAARLGLPAGALLRCVDQLSGGERRRVALLRALSVRPEVLVCDEPLASLDRGAARAVTQLLFDVRRDWGLTMVLFSHDREWCDAVADRVLELRHGRLCS